VEYLLLRRSGGGSALRLGISTLGVPGGRRRHSFLGVAQAGARTFAVSDTKYRGAGKASMLFE
jgi:hypothetical protein